VIEVVQAIRSVRFPLLLGSFRMNAFVLLPLQESMAQRGAGKHDQWRGYMTVLVVNHEIMKSISILTAVIHLEFDQQTRLMKLSVMVTVLITIIQSLNIVVTVTTMMIALILLNPRLQWPICDRYCSSSRNLSGYSSETWK
jgi:hypothetical protein